MFPPTADRGCLDAKKRKKRSALFARTSEGAFLSISTGGESVYRCIEPAVLSGNYYSARVDHLLDGWVRSLLLSFVVVLVSHFFFFTFFVRFFFNIIVPGGDWLDVEGRASRGETTSTKSKNLRSSWTWAVFSRVER